MDTKISEIISILPADLQPLLLQHNAFLKSEIKRLKDQLQLDSHNSSKPPSTDIGRKQKYLLSGKFPGYLQEDKKDIMEQLLNKYPILTIRTRLKWLFVNIAEKSYLLFHRKRLKKDKFLIYLI